MSAIALVEDYLKGRNDPLKAVKESLDHCERDRNGSFLNLDHELKDPHVKHHSVWLIFYRFWELPS